MKDRLPCDSYVDKIRKLEDFKKQIIQEMEEIQEPKMNEEFVYRLRLSGAI